MTEAIKEFMDCTDKIMKIYEMFEQDDPDHDEIERILQEEICPVICSDIHKSMCMFLAFHTTLNDPAFMEVIYLDVFKYIDQNNLLKEGILFNTSL